jgi:hypothetical protein
MIYCKLIFPAVVLSLMTSCIIPLPTRVGTRRAIRTDKLSFLEKGSVTREEVILNLGKPEDISGDMRIFDYKWIGAWNITIVAPGIGGFAGSTEEQKCNILRFQFDEHGIVEHLFSNTYKPAVLLHSNGDCLFDRNTTNNPRIVSTATNLDFLLKQKVSSNRTFIKRGQTNRQEVLQRLGWADAGLNENRLFWGRWSESSSGLSSVSGLASLNSAISPNRKVDTISNLLVEFDESGVVVGSEKVKDKDIIRELNAWSQRSGQKTVYASALNQNSSYQAKRKGWRSGLSFGSMRMRPNGVEFRDGTTGLIFRVPYYNIVSLKLNQKGGVRPKVVFELSENTIWGHNIEVSINPQDILTFLRYLAFKSTMAAVGGEKSAVAAAFFNEATRQNLIYYRFRSIPV